MASEAPRKASAAHAAQSTSQGATDSQKAAKELAHMSTELQELVHRFKETSNGHSQNLARNPLTKKSGYRVSSASLRKFQKLSTVEICTRSSGLCGFIIVGPNEIICMPGYFS